MSAQSKKIGRLLRRRDFCHAVAAFGAAAVLKPPLAIAESIAEKLRSALTGELRDLTEEAREEAAYYLGLESYVFGYPIVLMDVTRKMLTAAPAPNDEGTAAPINQLAKMPHYVSPDFKNVVRISLNSLWTTGWVDLDKEPIVLSVPDTHNRYYVFSTMDMWTNVFASVGKRTTGTGPGNFLFAGPKWDGAAPSDIRQTIRSPTRYAWVLGQTQANGPDDFAAVNAIQAQYKLTPLSDWGQPYTPSANVPVDGSVDLKTIPPDQVAAMDAGMFFNRLAMLMKENPPYSADFEILWKLKKIGVETGKPFDTAKIDPAITHGLNRAVKDVMGLVQQGIGKMKTVNGWLQPPDIGAYGKDYNLRAGIAYIGLGANMQDDTIYPSAFVDGDGKPLDGANNYVMHYEQDQLPPTYGTWSVSQYQGNFYVRNSIDRYAIAPWMPLKYNADGSLDIYFQVESPGKDKESNWLPVPHGPFNVTIRNYWPKEEALDGTYKNPPIRKVQ